MIRLEQKLTLLSSARGGIPDQSKDISMMTILRDIMKDQPGCTEKLAQAIHDQIADDVYRSVSKGRKLVLFDAITFIPGHLDLGPEDFPPDDTTLHVRVDLVQPKIPEVDPGCLVIPDPEGRPM